MKLTVKRKGIRTEHWTNITAEDVCAILRTLDKMGAQYTAVIEREA